MINLSLDRSKGFIFSSRELEVLDLIADGMTAQKIGKQLFVSRRTIEGTRQSMLAKCGAKNSAALVAYAFRNNFIV